MKASERLVSASAAARRVAAALVPFKRIQQLLIDVGAMMRRVDFASFGRGVPAESTLERDATQTVLPGLSRLGSIAPGRAFGTTSRIRFALGGPLINSSETAKLRALSETSAKGRMSHERDPLVSTKSISGALRIPRMTFLKAARPAQHQDPAEPAKQSHGTAKAPKLGAAATTSIPRVSNVPFSSASRSLGRGRLDSAVGLSKAPPRGLTAVWQQSRRTRRLEDLFRVDDSFPTVTSITPFEAPTLAAVSSRRRGTAPATPEPTVINSSPTVVVQAGVPADIERRVMEVLRQHSEALFEQWQRVAQRRQRTEL